jgi:hypothetical protein
LVAFLNADSGTRSRIPPDLQQELKDMTDQLLGPQSEMGPNKAYLDKDKGWVGGIPFERSPRARCLRNAPRCYSVGGIAQEQKRMSAVGAHGKVYDLVKDEDAIMRYNLVRLGSRNAMLGMDKGPEGLVDRLKTQADLTNVPRVGTDDNVFHPYYQLNGASAAEHRKDSSSNITSLGKFGKGHIDPRDCPGVPTAMHILSPEYDGVEDEYFYMMELGIGWLLEPFCTLYFSGLHFHGGSQPFYKKDRADKSFIYYRLALIAYPPDDALSGQEAIAFASLPNKKLLSHGYEFRQACVSKKENTVNHLT